MTFSQIQGNEDVRKALAGMVDSGRVPHAIMFHEDDGGGAFPIAIAFLQYLYCRSHSGSDSCGTCPSCNRISKLIHPDVHFVFPSTAQQTSLSLMPQFRELALSNPCFTETELNEALDIESKSSIIAVGEAKSLIDTLSLSALEGGYRSVVMLLPEKMNQEAANRLLKLIEEPPEKTQFLLITHAPEKVLTTISSRCQRIRVVSSAPVKAVSGESASIYADLFGQLMDALVSRDLMPALEIGEALAALPSRESAKAFCRYSADCLRQMFMLQQGLPLKLSLSDDRLEAWSRKCRKTFPRMASEAFDRAVMLIGRNVNLKILFTDLVDRLYMII